MTPQILKYVDSSTTQMSRTKHFFSFLNKTSVIMVRREQGIFEIQWLKCPKAVPKND